MTGFLWIAGQCQCQCESEENAFTLSLSHSLCFQWVGAETEHVAIGIFDVHFEGPGVVGGGHAYGDALVAEAGVQVVHVAEEAYPDPGAGMALAVAAEVDAAVVAADGSEVIVAPFFLAEAEDVDVEGAAGLHVFYVQYGLQTFYAQRNRRVCSHNYRYWFVD